MTAALDDKLRQRLVWMHEGTTRFIRALEALDDSELATDSRLPGWERRHVVAHVGQNAVALGRLVRWAKTGEETRMYSDSTERERQIEASAQLPPADLRALVEQTAADLHAALSSLPADRWSAEVVTAQGRTVAAAEIPWLRIREVWVHAVDLNNGASFSEFSAPLVDAFLTDLLSARQRGGRPPALLVEPVDRDRAWSVVADGAPRRVLRGPAHAILAALTGRTDPPDGSDVRAEELGAWL